MTPEQKLLIDLYNALFGINPPYPCDCPPADPVYEGFKVIGANPHYSCVYCRLQQYIADHPDIFK